VGQTPGPIPNPNLDPNPDLGTDLLVQDWGGGEVKGKGKPPPPDTRCPMDVFDQLVLHAADWGADAAVDAQLAQLSAFDLHDESDGGQDYRRKKTHTLA
jgi:hypothetical protein